MPGRLEEVVIPFHLTLLRPNLQCNSQVFGSFHFKEILRKWSRKLVLNKSLVLTVGVGLFSHVRGVGLEEMLPWEVQIGSKEKLLQKSEWAAQGGG